MCDPPQQLVDLYQKEEEVDWVADWLTMTMKPSKEGGKRRQMNEWMNE